MFGEMWNFVRANFKKRLILYAVVVYSLTIFGSFPTLEVKLAFLLMFFATSGLFMPIYATQFLSRLQQILLYRKRKKIPIPDEMMELAKRIGGPWFGSLIMGACSIIIQRNPLKKLSAMGRI
jgi:hypothetical protein